MPSWLSGVWGLSSTAFVVLIVAVMLTGFLALVVFLRTSKHGDTLRLSIFAFLKLEVNRAEQATEIPEQRNETIPTLSEPETAPKHLKSDPDPSQ